MNTRRLTLLRKLVDRHNATERECGKHQVYSDGYERAMTQLGKFLSDLPELIQQISWLQDYQVDGALRLPGEADPGLQQETEPFEEYLVLGFLRGKRVDDLVAEIFEVDEDD